MKYVNHSNLFLPLLFLLLMVIAGGVAAQTVDGARITSTCQVERPSDSGHGARSEDAPSGSGLSFSIGGFALGGSRPVRHPMKAKVKIHREKKAIRMAMSGSACPSISANCSDIWANPKYRNNSSRMGRDLKVLSAWPVFRYADLSAAVGPWSLIIRPTPVPSRRWRFTSRVAIRW